MPPPRADPPTGKVAGLSTATDCIKRADWLLHQFKLVLTRLEPYFEQERIIGDTLGENPEIHSLRTHSRQIIEALTETKEELVIGDMAPFLVAEHLESAGTIAEICLKRLDELDAEQQAARGIFRARFGGAESGR